ncbi:unnamed protein product [Ceratitis capitata]|uniref:(Mediterranean fruit fly) hypothetical protein n=1 Tax=Ceratitis capitata TaxID=7213 RepID=A0A811V373_CERCA|nr:unnamed protein product [Ceratitis capitata]
MGDWRLSIADWRAASDEWVHLLIHFANRLYKRCLIDAFLIMCQFGHTTATNQATNAMKCTQTQPQPAQNKTDCDCNCDPTINRSATKVNGEWPRRLIVHFDMRQAKAQMRAAADGAAATSAVVSTPQSLLSVHRPSGITNTPWL